MNTKTNCFTAVLVAVGIAAVTPVSVEAKLHSTKVYTVQDEAARMLQDAEEQAYHLHDHAVMLQSADGERLQREFFIAESSRVREEVNAMGKTIAHLQSLESIETIADRDVVERAHAELAQIARTTEGAIAYLNENPNLLWTPAYREMTTTLRDETGTLWKMLHDSVRMDKLHQNAAASSGQQ